VPVAGDALEGLGAAVVELEFRADHKVLDGACDEYLSRSGERADARADVHADTGDVVGSPLDLTGVQTGAYLRPSRKCSVPM